MQNAEHKYDGKLDWDNLGTEELRSQYVHIHRLTVQVVRPYISCARSSGS